MYLHTIEGLFEAAAKGTLANVEEVVKSGKVDVNQLHGNKHIITDLLQSNYPQREEKIDFLIKSGAILQFDDQRNILVATYKLKNLELKRTMITLIKETRSFKNKYTPYHFAALEGVAPKTAEEALVKDYFVLYPIHYAFKSNVVDDNWFENIEYDFFTPIEDGLYEGINLFWWSLVSPHRYRKLKQLLENLPAGNYFKLLKSAPLNPNHPEHGITLAWRLVDELEKNLEYEYYLPGLMKKLTAEQCYEILKSAPLNPQHSDHGVTVAYKFLRHSQYNDFTNLAQYLTAEQRYELLKSAPLNLNDVYYRDSAARRLLVNHRNENFTRLTQNLTAEQRYELLKLAPLNPAHGAHGQTVAHLLLVYKRDEDFTRLTQNLTAEQRYELLKLAPLNPSHPDHGRTVACNVLVNHRNEDFARLTQNLTAAQLYEILKSGPLNPYNSYHGRTVAGMLLEDKRFEDAAKLMQKLSAQQRYELLKLKQQNAQNSLYIVLLVGLLEARCYTQFEMIINGLNIDQLMELLLEANIESQQKIKNLNLLKYLAKENESLLLKILEPYEITELVTKVYKKLRKDNIAYDPVCYVLLEKTNIALRALMQSSNDKFDEEKELVNQSIKEHLKALIDLYEQLAANKNYVKKASEIVGMTVSEASQLWCRDIIVEYFDGINNADYLHIKAIDSLHALEGYGHYLKVLGCDDRGLARQLGVEYAQSKSGKNKSEINKEPAKLEIKAVEGNNLQDLNSLKRKIIELEEENKKLKIEIERKTSSSDNINKGPESIGGDPRLFARRTKQGRSDLGTKRKRDAVNEQVTNLARTADEPVANMNVR